MNEFQLDTFSYRNATRAGSKEYKDVPPSFTYILVGTNSSTRVVFARVLTKKYVGSIATAMVAMVPEQFQPMIRTIRNDDGNEFQNLLPHLESKGWHFPESSQSDLKVTEYTTARKVSELNGLTQQMENKAGTMLSGTGVTVTAPVETMVRTTRELIEQWKRAGDSSRERWQQVLPRLLVIYNHTIHSAFDNQYTPAQLLEDASLRQRYKGQE